MCVIKQILIVLLLSLGIPLALRRGRDQRLLTCAAQIRSNLHRAGRPRSTKGKTMRLDVRLIRSRFIAATLAVFLPLAGCNSAFGHSDGG